MTQKALIFLLLTVVWPSMFFAQNNPGIGRTTYRNSCWTGTPLPKSNVKRVCDDIYTIEVLLPPSVKTFTTDKLWVRDAYVFTEIREFNAPNPIPAEGWKIELRYTSGERATTQPYARPSANFKSKGLLRYIENDKQKYLKIKVFKALKPN
ncbi:MAG: hypothetical protein IT222_11440 [Crocinitomix sp.]|nr:hypothetical protein [Crocinitomix sp.]